MLGIVALLKLVLGLALLSPLWLTILYAWQRGGERAHGTLEGWQDATPTKHRLWLVPAKRLAWSLVHRIRGATAP